jgi:hypothetical protein
MEDPACLFHILRVVSYSARLSHRDCIVICARSQLMVIEILEGASFHEGCSRGHSAMDLTALARKYIWWQSPQESLRDRRRLIAQVMNIGTHADVEALRCEVGDEEFKRAIQQAQPGEFSARSWNYWHLILDLAKPHAVPPMPTRNLAGVATRDIE